jgi:hypothetical protein
MSLRRSLVGSASAEAINMMLLWNYRLPLVARWRSQMQELWRTNQLPPGYNVPQFHAILHRFDLIAG